MPGLLPARGGVDDLGMVDKLVHPGEEQVRLVPPVALQRCAGLTLVLLETSSVARHLGDLYAAVGGLSMPAQRLRHASSSARGCFMRRRHPQHRQLGARLI